MPVKVSKAGNHEKQKTFPVPLSPSHNLFCFVGYVGSLMTRTNARAESRTLLGPTNDSSICTKMADKEATVFVVDLSLAASPKAYNYMFDTLAAKLVKGLKTDYVSVVAFHSSRTNHALAETGKFQGINVLVDFEAPTYNQVKRVKEELVPENYHLPDTSDGFQALVFSVSLFEQTRRKAFKRNLVVITAWDSPMESISDTKIAALLNLTKDLALNLVVIGPDLTSHNPASGQSDWISISCQFDQSHVLSLKEAAFLSRNCPPVKKTRPMPTYRGDLRFGADFSKLLSDKRYDPSEDDSCLVWKVEVYPAAKSEIALNSLHEYIVDGDKIVRVERNTKQFVWEKNSLANAEEALGEENADDKLFDKVYLGHDSTVPGFKFSNFDLLALDSDLRDASKLDISSEFDIFGFLKINSIPYCYFTDDASFIVPEKSSSFKNTFTHFAFCQTLFEKQIAPVARFVRKQAKEVEVGAMIPVKVKDGSDFSYCYVFIRLPFKEDEKIGNFPRLAEKNRAQAENKEDLKETNRSKLDDLMDSFVNECTYVGKDDLDDTRDYKTTIDNFKVTMKGSDSSKLNLPIKGNSTDPFLCNSPGSNKFSNYLKRAILKSMEIDDWMTYCQDPKFVEMALKENKGATNLLNLENALLVNSNAKLDWLQKISNSSRPVGKRLVEELGIKYLQKVDAKKQKGTKNVANYEQKGNYGADEGEYGSVPDFGF